jgi:arylesterase / paraoxonase
VIVPYVADRRHSIALLYTNRPSQLQEVSAFKDYKIAFQDVVRNCEDVVLDEELGIAYFSCDPGRDRWNTVMVDLPCSYQTECSIFYLGNFHRPGL